MLEKILHEAVNSRSRREYYKEEEPSRGNYSEPTYREPEPDYSQKPEGVPDYQPEPEPVHVPEPEPEPIHEPAPVDVPSFDDELSKGQN